MRKLTGRSIITSDVSHDELHDKDMLCEVINQSYVRHLNNKSDIDWLKNYKRGIQPVLEKTKAVRSEINNKLVINHAQMITRNIVGYFLGNPIQYIQNGYSDKKDEIDLLNRYVQYEDKASVDRELGEYQSITGTAYRIIYKDGEFEDEIPFEDRALDPSTTYVVYQNGITETPLVAVTYHGTYNLEGEYEGNRLFAYTRHGVYTIQTDDSGEATVEGIVDFTPYNVNGIPIIEYPNNMWRIGDWELAIGLMDAINDLHSGRLDDIDQIVQSLLVFINAEIDGETYDEMRDKGAVMLKNTTGAPTGVESINNALDQTGMNMFAEELEDLLYAIIGIPSRNKRSGGGGDTGQAVELRDGWADLEIIARNKELTFKKAEKRALKIILSMFNSHENKDLSLLDLDIKFSRNKTNNLLVKTQAYQTLLSTKTLSPGDCLSIVDLVSDVNEYMARGEEFWGEQFGQIKPTKSGFGGGVPNDYGEIDSQSNDNIGNDDSQDED